MAQSGFHSTDHDLDGRMLRMLTLPAKPFVIRHRNDTHTWYTGLCIDLLNILAANLNFTYVISEPKDNNWGQQLANGTWVGMTGMLHRKEADFALSIMSLTGDRGTVSDYTKGYHFDEFVLMTRLPDPTPKGWTFYARPFHWLVFCLLGCGLIVCALSLALTDVYGRQASPDLVVYEEQTRPPKFAASVLRAVDVLFGALIGRAVIYNRVPLSGNILLCAWLLVSMVMVASYTGKLTSNAVVTRQPVPFTTVSELVKRTDYRWGLGPASSLETFMVTSPNKDYQLFYRKMLTFAEDDPDIMTRDTYMVAQRKVMAENYVRMTTKSAFLYLKKEYCELTLVKERLSKDTNVIYLQKDSPYTSLFDEVITKAWETGITDRLMRTWFPENTSCNGDETKAVPVSLDLLPTVFIMAAGGLGVAAIMLVLERL